MVPLRSVGNTNADECKRSSFLTNYRGGEDLLSLSNLGKPDTPRRRAVGGAPSERRDGDRPAPEPSLLQAFRHPQERSTLDLETKLERFGSAETYSARAVICTRRTMAYTQTSQSGHTHLIIGAIRPRPERSRLRAFRSASGIVDAAQPVETFDGRFITAARPQLSGERPCAPGAF